jgi:hypothetical protein
MLPCCRVAEDEVSIAAQRVMRKSMEEMENRLDFPRASAGRDIPWLWYHNLDILLAPSSINGE